MSKHAFTFTMTATSQSKVEGFNDKGQRFLAIHNGGGRYYLGMIRADHANNLGEVDTWAEALEWVAGMLSGTRRASLVREAGQ
jgi:hypothetical protein